MLALVAVSMVAMMGVLVLAIDGGNLQRQRRIAQTAADAGALAGAVEKWRARPEEFVYFSAQRETARNGFTHRENGVTVEVDPRPTSGTFTGPNYVKVVVTQAVPTILAGLFGSNFVTARSEGVAGVETSTNCIFVLDPSAANTLEIVAQSEVIARQCEIAVNSTNASAVSVAGDLIAGSISVTGSQPRPGGVSGTWQANAVPSLDPLATLVPPAPGACKDGITTGWNPSNGTTLTPGTYCGGIRMGNNTTVTLATGEYIIAGGGIDMKNATLRSAPGGVLIVNANPVAGVAAPFAGFIIDTNSEVDLTAMTTGTLPEVVFYSNPSGLPTGTTTIGISLLSGSNMTLNGSVYLPGQEVNLKTNVDFTVNRGGIVAKTIYAATGNGSFEVNGGGGPSAVKRPTLVR